MVLAQWADRDPDAAVAALADIREEQVRESAMVRVIQVLARQPDRVTQIEQLYNQLGSLMSKRAAAQSLASTWAESKPELAQRYLQNAAIPPR
jgi:hypothetical protein